MKQLMTDMESKQKESEKILKPLVKQVKALTADKSKIQKKVTNAESNCVLTAGVGGGLLVLVVLISLLCCFCFGRKMTPGSSDSGGWDLGSDKSDTDDSCDSDDSD